MEDVGRDEGQAGRHHRAPHGVLGEGRQSLAGRVDDAQDRVRVNPEAAVVEGGVGGQVVDHLDVAGADRGGQAVDVEVAVGAQLVREVDHLLRPDVLEGPERGQVPGLLDRGPQRDVALEPPVPVLEMRAADDRVLVVQQG